MDVDAIMTELAQYIRLQEEATAIVDSLKDELKKYMDANKLDAICSDEHKATYKVIRSNRIDTAALKREHPEIARAYTAETETRRFTFA